MTVNERVKFWSNQTGVTQYRISKDLGISTAAVNQFFTGKSGLSVETISKLLAAYPSLNARWLLTGEGEPFEGGAVTTTVPPAKKPVDNPMARPVPTRRRKKPENEPVKAIEGKNSYFSPP